ncbi:MAG: CehA/McbA family metallohydrolase [Bacteroidota bacterium]
MRPLSCHKKPAAQQSLNLGISLLLLISGCVNSGTEFTVQILDESEIPTAARIRITDMKGNYIAPEGHTVDFPMTTSGDQEPVEADVLLDEGRRFAYVDGSFSFYSASDSVRIEVVKGFHYRINDQKILLKKDDEPITINLEKAFVLPAEPWYTGDVHVHHINKESALLEMKAEDVNVTNLLISDFTLDHQHFRGTIEPESDPEHLLFYGQEYREDRLGHIDLLNLTKNLIEPSVEQRKHQYPLNIDAMDKTHEQGGHVSLAHFAAWPGLEGPLGIVFQKVDAVELLCTIDPFHEPIFASDVVPEVRMNSGLKLWYRLLNCGFKIPVTGGTDKMGNFVTVGANRTYALVENEFNYVNWVEALNEGRTFVSNSPFLSFKVDGQDPGSIINGEKERSYKITAEVWSQMPVDRLEIVANGELVAETTITSGEKHKSLEIDYKTNKSVWITARAYQLAQRERRQGLSMAQRRNEYAGPTQLNRYYGTLRPEVSFAHTSPVYIEIKNQPIRSSVDAEYFVQYLQNAIDWLEREGSFPSDEAKQEVLTKFRLGRDQFVLLAR